MGAWTAKSGPVHDLISLPICRISLIYRASVLNIRFATPVCTCMPSTFLRPRSDSFSISARHDIRCGSFSVRCLPLRVPPIDCPTIDTWTGLFHY